MGESADGDWGDKGAPVYSISRSLAISRRRDVVEGLSKAIQCDNLKEARVCGGSRGEWPLETPKASVDRSKVWGAGNVRNLFDQRGRTMVLSRVKKREF